MKLVWKLSIPQAIVVICFGLISFVIVNSSFITMRDQYVRTVIEYRFNSVIKGIESSARESINQTSVFVNLPVVLRAYKIALSGDIYDVNSPQSQAARELLRKELAPMLESYHNTTGRKLQLHFHLPNGFSLARLWREKNTRIDGTWVDISDDLRSFRPTVLEVNKSGKTAIGLEPGSGGFAIRGVIPVMAPDGKQLGSAEVLRDFEPILEAIMVSGKFDVSLYANKELLEFSVDLQNPEKYPPKGDFVRVIQAQDPKINSMITPEFLSMGKKAPAGDPVLINRDSITLAVFPIIDFSGKQSGVLVCAMNTGAIYAFAFTAGLTLALMLAAIVMGSSIALMLGLRLLVTRPLNMVKAKIRDITEDRADLSERVPDHQKDEIGELAGWFNRLTSKVGVLIDGLREAEERAQGLLDSTPLCAILLDENFGVIYCNKVVETMFDLPDRQEFKDRFNEFMPQYQPCGRVSLDLALEYVARALAEGSVRFEWLNQKQNGEPIPCEITLVRFRQKGSNVLAAYILDLRERHKMLNELRKESSKFETMAHWYESIINAIPFPVSVQDVDEKWTFINAALEKLLGKQRKDVIGLPCASWGLSICGTDNCAISCAKRGLAQTRFINEGASYQVDVAALKGLQGEIAGYIEVIQDITTLERLAVERSEAEAASRAKSAFLARMSHEIRTPINAVLGITEMRLQDSSLPHDIQEAFGKIYTAGYSLLNIINDILDLSKIEQGKVELSPARYEVASLISDTVQLNLARNISKLVDFILHVEDEMPSELFGDELRIRQVLNNLLSNAFKYTQEGKVELSVSVERENDPESSDVTLVCSVRDTGQGLTAEQVRLLFEEYTRFNVEYNRMIEGSGLGMNITRHLVNLMGGEISVESEPGKGSVFTVRLPQGRISTNVLGAELAGNLRLYKKVAMPRTRASQFVRDMMPYGSVLIVDDVESNLYVAGGLMAPYGLSIETVTSGFEAIDKIKEGKTYDIVFMDHMMPKMDGMETTKILREMGYAGPIITLTANAIVGQAEVFLKNGFDDFLSKPIDLRQLNAILNKWVRDKHPPEVVEAARRMQGGILISHMVSEKHMDPKLAEVFVCDAEKAFVSLEAILKNQYRRNDDMQVFLMNMHAMRSALTNIGEMELADVAYRLDKLGQNKDLFAVMEETPAFLRDLRELIDIMSSWRSKTE